jgi:hypothetical protein
MAITLTVHTKSPSMGHAMGHPMGHPNNQIFFKSPIVNRNFKKRLGDYLVEAHLVTSAHIEVALRDQELTGYRLGDILVLRGWVKRELVEWVVEHKLLPERNLTNKVVIDQTHQKDMTNPKDLELSGELFNADTVISKITEIPE